MTMKQFIYILLALILSTSCSTTQERETPKATETSLEPQVSNYQLFETKNLWTFLRLDTRNGKITQVHFTLDSNGYRGEQVLSKKPLVTSDEEKAGRFTLYPTQNMYTFILLDKISGHTYQVQWALNEEERFVIPIRK